jgi:hypothetical protein
MTSSFPVANSRTAALPPDQFNQSTPIVAETINARKRQNFFVDSKAKILTDRLSAFDRRLVVAKQRPIVTMNDRVGVGGLGYPGGCWRKLRWIK